MGGPLYQSDMKTAVKVKRLLFPLERIVKHCMLSPEFTLPHWWTGLEKNLPSVNLHVKLFILDYEQSLCIVTSCWFFFFFNFPHFIQYRKLQLLICSLYLCMQAFFFNFKIHLEWVVYWRIGDPTSFLQLFSPVCHLAFYSLLNPISPYIRSPQDRIPHLLSQDTFSAQPP